MLTPRSTINQLRLRWSTLVQLITSWQRRKPDGLTSVRKRCMENESRKLYHPTYHRTCKTNNDKVGRMEWSYGLRNYENGWLWCCIGNGNFTRTSRNIHTPRQVSGHHWIYPHYRVNRHSPTEWVKSDFGPSTEEGPWPWWTHICGHPAWIIENHKRDSSRRYSMCLRLVSRCYAWQFALVSTSTKNDWSGDGIATQDKTTPQ